MDLIVTLIITYFIAKFVLVFFATAHKVVDEARKATLAEVDEIVHRVKVESHQGVNYWFDEDDDEFLGQGKTLQEIIDHVKSRFPGHLFFMMEHEKTMLLAERTNWQFEEFKL
jgi:hypothetical protein